MRGRRGRRRKKLLDNLKERREYSHLKEEALDQTTWRARFGRGFGPVARQTTKWWWWVIKLLHASVLWRSNASLNAKRLERIQRNLQLSVPNSLFLPRTSTATITLLHFTIFIHRLYKREVFNLTQYLWLMF